MIIIRGASGSGKTTYSEKFVEDGYVRVESDDFFMVDGIYKWDQSKLTDIFRKQFIKVTRYLFSGQSVVVPGCFTKLNHMAEYILFCEYYNIAYEIYEMKTQYQNVHGVTADKVESMRTRFQPYAGAIHVY